MKRRNFLNGLFAAGAVLAKPETIVVGKTAPVGGGEIAGPIEFNPVAPKPRSIPTHIQMSCQISGADLKWMIDKNTGQRSFML